jgi:hypothetical protein
VLPYFKEFELRVKGACQGKSRMGLQRRLVETGGRLIKCKRTLCPMNRSSEAEWSISWRYSFRLHIRSMEFYDGRAIAPR